MGSDNNQRLPFIEPMVLLSKDTHRHHLRQILSKIIDNLVLRLFSQRRILFYYSSEETFIKEETVETFLKEN